MPFGERGDARHDLEKRDTCFDSTSVPKPTVLFVRNTQILGILCSTIDQEIHLGTSRVLVLI